MYIDLFEEFVEKKTKKKRKKNDGNIENYEPPKYVVQPHKGETGFFLVKKEFEKMKNRFSPGISYSYADEE